MKKLRIRIEDLEKKIVEKVYHWEAERTTLSLLLKIILFLFLLSLSYVLAWAVFDILVSQQSFDLLNFFTEDWSVFKKYFFDNLINFYQELPQPLAFILLLVLLLLTILIAVFLANFKKIKNKLISIYKFYKKI